MKILTAYFSATETTAKVAQQIAQISGGDLYEIKPSVKYTAADLDWKDQNSRSSVEMQNKASRPEIIKDLEDVQQYETIYIGFPIWWYTAPTIINTFMEAYDFSGKKVYLFATSGGSSITKAVEDLRGNYPSVKIEEGKLSNGTSDREIAKWIGK
ncbi:MAG: NAD(P)H-dependent oxidoreductase [Bacteroidales bacterium]|nr:NAD(P)H-dependent oxidoreductase [Bacteroidales bacterium]